MFLLYETIDSFSLETFKRLPLRDAVEKRLPPDEVFEPEFDIDIEVDTDSQKSIVKTPQVFSANSLVYQLIPNYPPPSYLKTPGLVMQKTAYNPLLRFQTITGHVEPYKSDNFYQQLLGSPRGRSLNFDASPNGTLNNALLKLNNIVQFLGFLQQNEKKVVCYYESQSTHRREPLAFNPDDINPFACTHLIYAFATIDPHSYELISRDEEYDIVQGKY